MQQYSVLNSQIIPNFNQNAEYAKEMQDIINKIKESLKSIDYKDLNFNPLGYDIFEAIKLGDGVTISNCTSNSFTLSIDNNKHAFEFMCKNNIAQFRKNFIERLQGITTDVQDLQLGEATKVMSVMDVSDCQKMHIELLHAYFNATNPEDKKFMLDGLIQVCNNICENPSFYQNKLNPYNHSNINFDETGFRIDKKDLKYDEAVGKMNRYLNRRIMLDDGYEFSQIYKDQMRYKEYVKSKISSHKDRELFQKKYDAPQKGI